MVKSRQVTVYAPLLRHTPPGPNAAGIVGFIVSVAGDAFVEHRLGYRDQEDAEIVDGQEQDAKRKEGESSMCGASRLAPGPHMVCAARCD